MGGHHRNVESPSLPFFFFIPLQIHHPSKIKFTNYSTNNIIDTKTKIHDTNRTNKNKIFSTETKQKAEAQAGHLSLLRQTVSQTSVNQNIIRLFISISHQVFSFFYLVVTTERGQWQHGSASPRVAWQCDEMDIKKFKGVSKWRSNFHGWLRRATKIANTSFASARTCKGVLIWCPGTQTLAPPPHIANDPKGHNRVT